MKRRLLFAERMLHGDGTLPFNTVIPVKIAGSFPAERLHNGLARLQQKHPLLRACVTDDEKGMAWFVVKDDPGTIPVRVIDRTNNEDWQQASVIEWNTLFDTRKGPLMRVVWVKGVDTCELLLVMHHCFCDGEAAMSLMYELLQLIDDPTTDIGAEYAILDVKNIVPPEILGNRQKAIKAKIFGGLATLVMQVLPVKKKPFDRKGDYMINWKLDKELGNQLMAKCKAEGITVNTALCVAVLNAFKAVRKEQFFNKISCPVNIRRFAPQIKKDNIFAFGLMLVVSADKDLDFIADARKMQLDIDQKTAKLDPYGTIMMMEAAHKSLKKFTRFLKYAKTSNDCMFSNMGRINLPHEYKSFNIDTLFSPSVIGPLGNTTTLITSTYKGQMDFTFVGSEGYIPYDEALAIKEKLVAIISAQV